VTQPLRHRLAKAAKGGSRSERALATFMAHAFADLPFETAASLADKVGVSEATVGRFCRTIGYANFRDLKDHLREDIGDRPWLISDRLAEMRASSSRRSDAIAQGLELEIAALVQVYELARSPEWARVVDRLANAPRVFVAGFQTERGLAQYFCAQLQYVRDGVQMLDLGVGNFAELLASEAGGCLVIFEARRYSRLAKVLAEQAHAEGIAVTLVTDQFCTWAPACTDEVFAVPTQANQFWDSTAPMASLGNLMINDVFLKLGQGAENRLTRIARLYGTFVGHVGDPVAQVAK
jgi:DNA-binding MurR/RpiR family transcriptional regulator